MSLGHEKHTPRKASLPRRGDVADLSDTEKQTQRGSQSEEVKTMSQMTERFIITTVMMVLWVQTNVTTYQIVHFIYATYRMLFTLYSSSKNILQNNSGKSSWQIYIDSMSFLLPLEGDLIILPWWWQILAGNESVSTWFSGNAGWS